MKVTKKATGSCEAGQEPKGVWTSASRGMGRLAERGILAAKKKKVKIEAKTKHIIIRRAKMTTVAEQQAATEQKAAEQKAAAGPKGGGVVEPRADADPRLLQVVIAMVPAVGEVEPTPEQNDLALAMQALVEAAQQKVEGKAKSRDKGMVEEASARFFSADVVAAEQKKAAEKEATKEQKGQAAAGQPVHAK